jgi:hypothetical protein
MFEFELEKYIQQYKNGEKWNNDTSLILAAKGKINCLLFILNFGGIWHPDTLQVAILCKKYKIIEYALINSINISEKDIKLCINSKDIKIIDLFYKYKKINDDQYKTAIQQYSTISFENCIQKNSC